MFTKLKGAMDKGKEAIAEKKADMQEKKQNKWLHEVSHDGGDFLDYAGWKNQFEPVKEKKEAGPGKEPNVLERKAMETIQKKITAKVMCGLTDAVARPIDVAAAALKTSDPLLSRLLLNVEAVVLSYRFSYKSAKKFAWIRGVAADRLAQVLVEFMDAEAVRLGKDPAALKPEDVDAIVQTIAGKVHSEIDRRQSEAAEALKSSPIFAAAAGPEADKGVAAVMEFVRNYVQSKIGVVVAILKVAIAALGHIAAKHRNAVRTNLAANADPDQQDPEYVNGVRKELLEAIEARYKEVEGFVYTFIGGFFAVADAGPDDEEE